MSLQDSYGGSASNAEIDPKGGYWINTTKGRQHFPGTPPGATKPLPIPQPVSDFLTKASNVLEAPLTGIGATEMDLLRPPYLKVGLGPSGQHMLDELRHGQFGSAAQHYSTTSLEANRERAQLGDPVAQFLDKHPSMIFAPLAFGEEFFNPSNKLFGAVGKASRAVGLKPLDPLNRFADIRGAAAEAPAQRAAAAEAAAQRTARANAARRGAAEGNANARAAAHFAQKQADSVRAQAARQATNEWLARQKKVLAPPLRAAALGPGTPALESAPVGEQRLMLPPPPKEVKPPRSPSGPRQPTPPLPSLSPPRRVGPARVIPEPGVLADAGATKALNPGKPPGITVPGERLANRYGAEQAVTPVGKVTPLGPKPQLPTEDVADQAEVAFRKMTDKQTPKAFAQKATNDLYKDLPLSEQQRLFHAIEANKIPPEYQARYGRYVRTQRQVSKWLVEHGIADEGQLWNEPTFHPRSGALLNPDYDVEEQPGETVGSRGIRKGTLKNRRTFKTLKDAVDAGEQMNPEWAPAETLENTLTQRMTAIQLENGMKKLKDLGLIVGPDSPRPPGWVRLSDEPDVARFGSPTISGGASFHPAIAKGIRDITASTMNPEKLLSSPIHKIMTPFAMANRAAMRFQVAQPAYHLPVNVIPNQIATLLAHAKSYASLPEYVKQWFSGGKATGEMYESGTYFPYASDIPAHKMTRPWSDLSVKEKAERAWNLTGRGVENFSSKPLYGWAEPRAAKAMFRALKKSGMSDAKATLKTRQTIGEHENIGAAERDFSQMMKFPAWRKSVFRLWPSLLAKSPALYNAPHRGAQAFNLSRGVGPQPSDSGSLIPGIAWGKDAQGNPQTLSAPSPANIPLELLNILGSPLAGDTDQDMQRGIRLGLTMVNPLLNTGVRTAMTEVGSSGEPNSGLAGYRIYDKDAPENQTILGKTLSAIGQTAERNAPIRNEGTGPLGAVGLGIKPIAGTNDKEDAAIMESRYRKMIARLRYAARDDLKAGDTQAAAQDNQDADDLHREMEQVVQQMSTPSGAVPAAAAGDTLQSRYGSSPAVSPAP